MESELTLLLRLISTNSKTLMDACSSNNWPLPTTSNMVYDGRFRSTPTTSAAADVIVAAALQIATLLTPPHELLLGMVNGHYHSAALRVCIHSNIPEILRDAGPQGLHVDELAQKCNLHTGKLERLLRLLALRHVFVEGPPRVFRNSMLSLMLDTGKTVDELRESPENKHDGTSGTTAMIEIRSEGPEYSRLLLETLTHPIMGHSEEPNHTAFQYSVQGTGTFWSFIDSPEQHYQRRRFNIAMRAWAGSADSDGILTAYNWKLLPHRAKVVDVGGGLGSAMIPLLKHFQDLHCIVQDLPTVTCQAKETWMVDFSEALRDGTIEFQEHNFFERQPICDASVFYLRRILHDWSNKYGKLILQELHKVATPETKLMVAERILHPACADPINDEGKGVLGYHYTTAPRPLLANFAAVHEIAYMTDITMMALVNGQDRTISELEDLLRSSGWRILNVQVGDERGLAYILAEAIL
ncbi:S-adenosyl-L-methionine-dependent methyltransferase [Marasmius fiardii PR-910]|nr:S-adenosyl-L-methionine-dependent methyltransferase [Marasmius fiardii PR-910]